MEYKEEHKHYTDIIREAREALFNFTYSDDSLEDAHQIEIIFDTVYKKMLLAPAFETWTKSREKYKDDVIRSLMPNNWLKLHGYRMRRKCR